MGSITHLIIDYRYWVLVPLSMLEGPIVAFVAGTLAASGYFSIVGLGIFFFLRDIFMDAGYYALGYFGGRTQLAQKLMHKIGVRQEHMEEIRILWEKHAGETMFFGKLSYGIASSFIVAAGTVRMSLVRFFAYGALVAILQYGVLLMLGYYFGNALGGKISTILSHFQYAIAGIALVATGYYFFSRAMRRKLLKEEEKVAEEYLHDKSV